MTARVIETWTARNVWRCLVCGRLRQPGTTTHWQDRGPTCLTVCDTCAGPEQGAFL